MVFQFTFQLPIVFHVKGQLDLYNINSNRITLLLKLSSELLPCESRKKEHCLTNLARTTRTYNIVNEILQDLLKNLLVFL